MPDEYIKRNKNLLTRYPLLYFNMAMNQINVCKKIYQKYSMHIKEILKGAVSTGNLQMAKWVQGKYKKMVIMRAKFSSVKWTSRNIKMALRGKCPMTYVMWNNAALNGHLEILNWALKNEYCWKDDVKICRKAAINNHLEILKWARKNGFAWDSKTCAKAAKHGHLELLKWARENGCPWDGLTCDCAAKNGHLEILKYARENGCPWNECTCACAAQNGNLEILKYARENGCAR